MRYTTTVEKEAAHISYVLGAKATVGKHKVQVPSTDDLKLSVVERDHDVIVRSPTSFIATVQGYVGDDGLNVCSIVRRFTTHVYTDSIREFSDYAIRKHFGLVRGETNMLDFLDGYVDPVGWEFTITLFKTPIAVGDYGSNGEIVYHGGYKDNSRLVCMTVLEELHPGITERCNEIAKAMYRKPVEFPEHLMSLYNYKSLDSVDENWYESCTDLTDYQFKLEDINFVEIASERCAVFKKGDIVCDTEHALFTAVDIGAVLGLVIENWVVIPMFVLKSHVDSRVAVTVNVADVIAAIENAPSLSEGKE